MLSPRLMADAESTCILRSFSIVQKGQQQLLLNHSYALQECRLAPAGDGGHFRKPLGARIVEIPAVEQRDCKTPVIVG